MAPAAHGTSLAPKKHTPESSSPQQPETPNLKSQMQPPSSRLPRNRLPRPEERQTSENERQMNPLLDLPALLSAPSPIADDPRISRNSANQPARYKK
ncbi:hypothetical protein OUZ56_010388 [Daphnia magna]|uniref:Uncharacterized protein n=1 Tax=Daphnia magna TaxID=35525 RepID=A0ABR0AIJ0_9CRUS|nr:hypothetical protein OUZ56_010388 [Daphnia magna]